MVSGSAGRNALTQSVLPLAPFRIHAVPVRSASLAGLTRFRAPSQTTTWRHIANFTRVTSRVEPAAAVATSTRIPVQEKLGSIEGKTVAYLGDGNNIVHSWLRLARRLPFRFVCCCPEGYEPDPVTVALARSGDAKGLVEISHDPAAAVRGADAVYTDVWASMGQKEEADKRKRDFKGFAVRSPRPTDATAVRCEADACAACAVYRAGTTREPVPCLRC